MITEPQKMLLHRMGRRRNILANGDEADPQWWIEAGFGVKKNVAEALIRKKLIEFTGHEGGQPGILYYTVTEAGASHLEGNGNADTQGAR